MRIQYSKIRPTIQILSYQNDRSYLATVDNNDTVLYGCIRVALELQPSEENATLVKGVRQIGICHSVISI